MFNEGDTVWWTSQEHGSTKEYHGTVVQVVGSHRRPDRNRFPSLHKAYRGFGFSRDHESSVVRVRTTNYWPNANDLRRGVA